MQRPRDTGHQYSYIVNVCLSPDRLLPATFQHGKDTLSESAALPVVRKADLRSAGPLDQFLAGQLSERTRRAYCTDLRDFFRTEQVTAEMVQSVTFQDVIEYRNYLAAKRYKRTTINRKLSSLKSFYKVMVAAGVVAQNPADSGLVRGYRVDNTMTGKAIPKDAMARLLDAIAAVQDDVVRARDMALFHVLAYGGLRRSEAVRMDWNHIHQEGVFYVLELPETKSGVTQEVKLQPAVVHYLSQYKLQLETSGYCPEGPVFISLSRNRSHGQRLTDQSINLIVKRYAKRAGVPRAVTAHMFRHTCCTLAIEGGARPQQVQAHLRHKDLKTTMRYYENRDRLLDNASDYIKIG